MNEADDRDALRAGDVIAERYRVVRLLGQGGMGAVYEAENTWTTRRVAIKVLLPALSSDSRAVARFQGEAQAATRLQHPNIVDVLDMGKDPKSGAVYIVQEFLRGEDLHAFRAKRRQLAPAEAAEIMVPVMSALAVAHARGIIHRDIKPENIFLVGSSKELTPKLIDFGLAKVLGEDASARKTSTGTIMGTPYYRVFVTLDDDGRAPHHRSASMSSKCRRSRSRHSQLLRRRCFPALMPPWPACADGAAAGRRARTSAA